MKIVLLTISCMLFYSALWSQTSNEEKQVRTVLQKMHAAWEEHDYSYSKYDIFDDSAILINPVGEYKSKFEITKVLQFLGEARFKYETIVKDTILNIRFLAPTVALVTAIGAGRWNQDFNMPDGSPGGTKGVISEAIYSYTFIRENSKWKITSMHISAMH